MTTTLDEIVQRKRAEVAEQKELVPLRSLERSVYFKSSCVSLTSYLRRPDKVGIIAEIKRRSPSKGPLNQHIAVEELSIGYMQAGASALSVLTDQKYFGAKRDDLATARKFNFCPILRKDFTIDEYQIVEARSMGADAILLIAAILTPAEAKSFSRTAKDLGLEVLLEVHDAQEIESHFCADIDLLGVNNRDLKTLVVNPGHAATVAPKMPPGPVKVAESGIQSPEALVELRRHGFEGFLIGEAFMRTSQPALACRQFVRGVQELLQEQGAAHG